MDTLAEKLNTQLEQETPHIFQMLSDRGKEMYFPHQGILGQSAEAAGKRFNATIGIACNDDHSPMRLDAIANLIDLPPQKVFPYASSFGNPELRKTWKDMLFRKNPSLAGKEISLPVVTNGITHAIFVAGYLFLNPGDEITISTPFWDNYSLLFEEMLGAKIRNFPFFNEDGRLNLRELKDTIHHQLGKKIVLLFNYPNNPTGYTPLESEVEEIIAIIEGSAQQGTQLVILIDDAYFGLVYENGVCKESIFARLLNVHKNILAIKIDGATKEDYVWGLRVGFLTFGGELTPLAYQLMADKAAGVTRAIISNASQLSQSLLLKAFDAANYWDQKLVRYELLKKRFQAIKSVLDCRVEFREFFSPIPYNSGYFMCLKLHGIDPELVRRCLLEQYDTGVIAMAGLIRIAYSSIPVTIIPELLDNIYRACKQVKTVRG